MALGPTRQPLDDAAHWRDRADEARAMADHIGDPQAKAAMMQVAEGYEHLAKRAEARAAAPDPGLPRPS